MKILIGLFLVLLLTTIAATVLQSSRIFQGKNATVGHFPYLTLLRVHFGKVVKSCSGSLIDKAWILTAAHCLVNNSTYPVRILARLGSNTRSSGGVFRKGIEYAIHNEYHNVTMLNDIALIKISSVNFTTYQNIQAIALPSINITQSYVNKTVIAAGWGAVGNNKSSTYEFSQWSSFYIAPAENCRKKLRIKIPTSHMCLQPSMDSSLSSVCSGDSGGPVVTDTENNVLIGVASYISYHGCELGLPMFYTNVTYVLSWIHYYINLAQ